MTIAYERQHRFIMEMLKSHGPYHYQLPANGRHPHGVPHHIQMVQHQNEMVMRQQQGPLVHSYPPSHEMMMEMQQMPGPMPDQFGALHGQEMQPPQGQTFGDVRYPVSSAMDLGLPGSASYKHGTDIFFSNTMQHATENGGVHTPNGAPPNFYPPSTSTQLPPSTEHPSPPTTYAQQTSPPTELQPNTTSDLTAMTYTQPISGTVPPNPSANYPSSYPISSSHFVVTNTPSDSEQRMVSELITSISSEAPPHQTSSILTNASTASAVTRPLQHLDMDSNLPSYSAAIPTSDPYAATSTQQQQLYSPPQQPHSAGSAHSNRSPSALYPSPPNSDSLQHSEVAQQNGMGTMAYSHASPPSLTPSPENRDEVTGHNITTVEGLVQQHDYPSVLYGTGVDSYNYGVRFVQDYNNETTV